MPSASIRSMASGTEAADVLPIQRDVAGDRYVLGQAELLGHRVDDPDVGLVGDEGGEVARR